MLLLGCYVGVYAAALRRSRLCPLLSAFVPPKFGLLFCLLCSSIYAFLHIEHIRAQITMQPMRQYHQVYLLLFPVISLLLPIRPLTLHLLPLLNLPLLNLPDPPHPLPTTHILPPSPSHSGSLGVFHNPAVSSTLTLTASEKTPASPPSPPPSPPHTPLIPPHKHLKPNPRTRRKNNLTRHLHNPTRLLIPPNLQPRGPRRPRLEIRFELRDAVEPCAHAAGDVDAVRGRRGGDVERVGPVHEGCAQGDGRGVLDAKVQVGGVREDAVPRGRVGDGVADDLADFEGAGLLEEEHREGLGGVRARVIAGGSLVEGSVGCVGWWVSGLFRMERWSLCGDLYQKPTLGFFKLLGVLQALEVLKLVCRRPAFHPNAEHVLTL
ncbi:hypothetical protein VC83_03387 [Pseudogymnoascus destructans]|uniref:Uncharacterized protein n=1 Tax=Pseudogymnoascus destructans TaxID=655981 RepID=A0A177AGX4_9PEZI|nr:uncharacterized protein VC83_03387 [Pseudogymnoascus destructans]OAF60434.1 hypothetical protein VC83_03387 [Pseudogymnoascus destructans]